VWLRRPSSDLLDVQDDLERIIRKLMAMDVKLNRILEQLDGEEEEEDDTGLA
jgi:hypothetical protein